MAARSLDMNHGFIKFIIRNQVDRQRFHEEEKQRISSIDSRDIINSKQINTTEGLEREFDEPHIESTQSFEECKRISFEHLKRVPVDFNYRPLSSPPEKISSIDSRIFQLEFQTKFGDKIDVAVRARDTAEGVANQVTSQYPLDTEKKDALIKRLDKEIRKHRRNGH